MNSRMKISIIGIIFFVGMLFILLPDISEVPEERMASLSMAMCINEIRAGIKTNIEQGKPVKTDYKNKCPQLISKLGVKRNGRIEMFNQTHKISLSFEPVLIEGKVKWSCRGTPDKFVPKACRERRGKKDGND